MPILKNSLPPLQPANYPLQPAGYRPHRPAPFLRPLSSSTAEVENMRFRVSKITGYGRTGGRTDGPADPLIEILGRTLLYRIRQ